MGWDDVKKKQPSFRLMHKTGMREHGPGDYADLAFNQDMRSKPHRYPKKNGYYSGVDKSKGGFYGIDQKEATALAIITPLVIIGGGVYFAGSALLRSRI